MKLEFTKKTFSLSVSVSVGELALFIKILLTLLGS